jgi:hypothetical protein
MAHSTSHPMTIKNPGVLVTSGSTMIFFAILTGVGILTFLLGLKFDPSRTWASYVHNHFYFMSLGLGGIFFASLQWLTGAMWSAPIRRLSEAFAAYLPVVLITFLILYFGIHQLYSWSHPEHVQGDLILEGKAGYLNTGFFMIRNVLAILIWIFFSRKMIGNSIAQDVTQDYALTVQNRTLAPAFLLLFGVTFTMASFDLLMSLDPHWFSTMFGVYCFAGLFYSILASICLLALYLNSTGKLTGIVNDNHFHDLGKFMFAFTVFWAYIAFSQFMLIWYANLPEETGYYLTRLHGNWIWVSAFLVFGKFMIPFFFLLPRSAKRNPRILMMMGIFMLVAQWIDVMWMIQPEFFKEGPVFGWTEIGVTLGFLGLFGLAVSRFLTQNNVVAIGDPRLVEAVYHHHQ